MFLNTIKAAKGARKSAKRVGRGMGSGFGKTCGRGHKGQHSRSGGYHKVGFEGGQMPLQRRLPKFGFRSRKAKYSAELRLSELSKLPAGDVSLEILKDAGLVQGFIKKVKIIVSGEISEKYSIAADVSATKGAKTAIESAGGEVKS